MTVRAWDALAVVTAAAAVGTGLLVGGSQAHAATTKPPAALGAEPPAPKCISAHVKLARNSSGEPIVDAVLQNQCDTVQHAAIHLEDPLVNDSGCIAVPALSQIEWKSRFKLGGLEPDLSHEVLPCRN